MNNKRGYRGGLCAVALLMASFVANADTRIDQVWTCTLNEGNTVADLTAVHGKWIAWANKQTYGGDISGAIAQSMVASAFVVIIIDSYPDMATLSADWEAYESTKEGQALDLEYEKVATCASNALYRVTSIGAD